MILSLTCLGIFFGVWWIGIVLYHRHQRKLGPYHRWDWEPPPWWKDEEK